MTMTKNDDKPVSEAGEVRREFIDDQLLDQLLASTSERGLALTGEGGLLPELIRSVLERGMRAELTDHLGYEKHDPAGRGSGNSRNGITPEDRRYRGGPGRSGPAPGPERLVRVPAGAQRAAPSRWIGGSDHQPVCGRDDDS